MMMKKNYLQPEIRIRKIEMDSLLDNSITNIDGGDGNDPGYGGGGSGPAFAPKWGNLWDDDDPELGGE